MTDESFGLNRQLVLDAIRTGQSQIAYLGTRNLLRQAIRLRNEAERLEQQAENDRWLDLARRVG